jgi:hypothetical protein
MATYVLPQVLVFQDFTTQPAVAANPLSAHISGGHAQLIRYADDDERQFGLLGLYDNADDASYAWPSRSAGGVIDQSYSKLFIQNALLQYFVDPLSSGSSISVVAGHANRVRAANVNFASNGVYARDEDLYDRDVQVGDVVRVRGIPSGPGNDGNPATLWTFVKSLVADQLAAVIGEAVADDSNAATQSLSATITQTAGAENCVVATVDGSAYNGLAAGRTSETYVITVLDSSIDGDFTTARLRVSSGSGTDDQAEVTPAASGDDTAIGTRGLTVSFDTDDSSACSQSAVNDNVSPGDLIAGQKFTVTVAQDFTATAVDSGGGYDDREDTTYIVTVTKGGSYSSGPQVSVSTTNGIDQSGPHTVSGSGVEISIGTRGVTIEFSASAGLNKGDRFYVPVQGIGSGPIRTIVLGQNLDQHFAAEDEVGIELYIRKPVIEVTAERLGMAPLTNWDQSETEITLRSGIVAYDSSWTNSGVAMPLEVYSSADLNYGVAYVEYRSWLSELAYKVNSISDVADLDDIAGPLTPDNPLKWGVFKALSNSNGTPVLYTAVTNPDDVEEWGEVLEALLSRDDAYGLVPLTRNPTVLSLFQAHVNSSSAASEGLWRVAWFNLSAIPEIPVVSAGSNVPNHLDATTTDGQAVLAVFEDDGFTSGTQYTIVRVPAANSAFLANGVRPGDIVRALYTGDGFGRFTYSEFVVDEVQSENQLRVKVGPGAPQSVPAKIEVWRNLAPVEEAEEIGRVAGAYNDRRVRATWPDRIESSGTVQEGYFLNAALAGLSSAVLPQQGLTNVGITGFSSTQRTNDKFNKPQLDAMAVRGVWIVRQQTTGEIYTRHAITTGSYEDINQREEMLTRNVDSISYRFKDYFEPFIGVTNVTPAMRDVILGGMAKLIRLLQTERSTSQLGGQLIEATIDRFFVSEVFKDRYVAYINLQVPYALNTIELHLVV